MKNGLWEEEDIKGGKLIGKSTWGWERAKEDVEEGHIKKDVEDIEEDVGKLVWNTGSSGSVWQAPRRDFDIWVWASQMTGRNTWRSMDTSREDGICLRPLWPLWKKT